MNSTAAQYTSNIEARRLSASILLDHAADAYEAAQAAWGKLQLAQVRARFGDAFAAAAVPALVEAAWIASHRDNTARRIAERAARHTPTGRRPIYCSAPGAAARLTRDALAARRRQTWTYRIGYMAAARCPRHTTAAAIFNHPTEA